MNKEQKIMEITLQIPVGGDVFPIETSLELITQLVQLSDKMSQLKNNYFEYDEESEEYMTALSSQLWKFLAKTFSIIGLTMCFDNPGPLMNLEQLLDDFSDKLRKKHNAENKDKNKEKIFFKENPNIN